MIEQFRIAGDGVDLAAERQGPASAPLVILLHGGGQSRSAWRITAGALADHGHRAVSIDLRGHGDSDWAVDGDYAFGRHVADLEAVIAATGGPATLVGASLGGHIALLTAASHPTLVRGVVLADITPFLDEAVADDLRARLSAGADGFASVAEAAAMLGRTIEGPSRRGNQRLREYLREGADGRLYWRWDPRVIEDRFVRHGGENGLFHRAATQVRVPLKLLRAGESSITTPTQVTRFREVVPQLEVVELAGLGHMLTGDSNRAYTPEILRFLERLPAIQPR